jgi:hypothetical protein
MAIVRPQLPRLSGTQLTWRNHDSRRDSRLP